MFSSFARAGGLMSYGPNLDDLYRKVGVMAGKFLKGTMPADLPVERPARFEMVGNLKAAKALDLNISNLVCKADGGEVISGELVVSGGDAPEVLQSVERILDTPAQLVEALAEAERLLPVAAVGNDRLGPALVQLLAQFGAVIRPVGKQPIWCPNSTDQALRDWTIVRLACGQQDSNQAPLSICECINLRVAPSARTAHSLIFLPLFHLRPSDAL